MGASFVFNTAILKFVILRNEGSIIEQFYRITDSSLRSE
jgi:hypothetical protein